MARRCTKRCTVCAHPRRKKIDSALASGTSLRDVSGQFGVSKSALDRHRGHVGGAIQKAAQRRGESIGDSVYQEMRELVTEARGLLAKMKSERDWRGGIAAVKTAAEILDRLDSMLARAATGADGGVVQIVVHHGDKVKPAEAREQKTCEVESAIVVRYGEPAPPSPALPEAAQEQPRPALPPPPAPIQRAQPPAGGGIVVAHDRPVFDFSKLL